MFKEFFTHCYELWDDEPGEFVFQAFITLIVVAIVGGTITGLVLLTINYFFVMQWIYLGILVLLGLPTSFIFIGKHIHAKQQ